MSQLFASWAAVCVAMASDRISSVFVAAFQQFRERAMTCWHFLICSSACPGGGILSTSRPASVILSMVGSMARLSALGGPGDFVASPSSIKPASRSAGKPCPIISTGMVMPCWTASARILSARRSSGAIGLLPFHVQAGAQPGLSATDARWPLPAMQIVVRQNLPIATIRSPPRQNAHGGF